MMTGGTHCAETIGRTRAVYREVDEQSDGAFLSIHDTVERHLIRVEMERNRRLADELDRQYQAMEDWMRRDSQENQRHERINARARERCQMLETAKTPALQD